MKIKIKFKLDKQKIIKTFILIYLLSFKYNVIVVYNQIGSIINFQLSTRYKLSKISGRISTQCKDSHTIDVRFGCNFADSSGSSDVLRVEKTTEKNFLAKVLFSHNAQEIIPRIVPKTYHPQSWQHAHTRYSTTRWKSSTKRIKTNKSGQ